jgi:hypothetical protein
MQTATLRKTTWNTYRTTGYTHDVGQDPRSQGGVHHHQIRHTKHGWETRILQSNGRFSCASEPQSCDGVLGQQHFEHACQLALE